MTGGVDKDSCRSFAGGDEARAWLEAGAGLVVVGASHLVAVRAIPMVRYGRQGAEYLEHIQRQHALDLTSDLDLWQLIAGMPRLLGQLDGQYPPLLHLLAAAWSRLFGDSIEASIHLNLLFILLLWSASAWLAAELSRLDLKGGCSGAGPESEPSRSDLEGTGLALSHCVRIGVIVTLLPAVFASARRYYYDLPLAAMTTVAIAALLAGVRGSRRALLFGGLMTGLACLVKWQAALYLAPWWLVGSGGALTRSMRERRTGPILWMTGAAGLVFAVCFPLLVRSTNVREVLGQLLEAFGTQPSHGAGVLGSSLDVALAQRAGPGASLAGIVQRVRFYLDGVCMSSVGPASATALGLSAIIGRRRRKVWAISGFVTAVPVTVLLVAVRPMDERFLLPLLPVLVCGCLVASSTWWRGRGVSHVASSVRWRGQTGHLVSTSVLVAGLLGLLSVDGALPPWLGPREPVERRGWNRWDPGLESPYRSYSLAARAICGSRERGGRIALLLDLNDSTTDLHAWRWAFLRRCEGWEPLWRSNDRAARPQVRTKNEQRWLAKVAPDIVMSDRPLSSLPGAQVRRLAIRAGSPGVVWIYSTEDQPLVPVDY